MTMRQGWSKCEGEQSRRLGQRVSSGSSCPFWAAESVSAVPYLGGSCGERTKSHPTPPTYLFEPLLVGFPLCAQLALPDRASGQSPALGISRLLKQSFVWGQSVWSSAQENVSVYAFNVQTDFLNKYPSAMRRHTSLVLCSTHVATSMS